MLERLTIAEHTRLVDAIEARDADGKLRSFVNVYLNEDDIRFLQKDATPLKEGATLIIVPSIAGGR